MLLSPFLTHAAPAREGRGAARQDRGHRFETRRPPSFFNTLENCCPRFRPNRAFPQKLPHEFSTLIRKHRWIRIFGGNFRVQLGNQHGFLIEQLDCPPIPLHPAQRPMPG